MGCAPSRGDVSLLKQVTPHDPAIPASEKPGPALASDEAEYAELREKVFSQAGTARELKVGEVLIAEGARGSAFYYIRNGTVALEKRMADGSHKEIGKRSKGNIVGEMSFLIGEAPGVSVVAKTPVSVWEVQHEQVLSTLQSNPKDLGLLLKMMATYLGDRIHELSAALRTEVSSENKVSGKRGMPADATVVSNVVKYRMLFGIDSDVNLLLRTTCSMRKEVNAVKDQNLAFGEMFIFESHLCFDWKVFGFHRQLAVPFSDVLAVLVTRTKQVEVQCKGMSYELNFAERQDEILAVMEQCRREVRAKELASERQTVGAAPPTLDGRDSDGPTQQQRDWMEGDETDMLRELIDDGAMMSVGGMVRRRSIPSSASFTGSLSVATRLDMTLTETDWDLFLSGAKLRRYNRDETVIAEGQPTSALYQIMQGSVRVELQLPKQAQSVVVAHRGMGEMFGEISLLKHGLATASIIADDENTVMYVLEGKFLDSLFRTEPGLPSRFYCFLATSQASRLRELSTAAVSATKPEVHASNYSRLSINEVMANAAWRRIFRKFLNKQIKDSTAAKVTADIAAAQAQLAAFELLGDISAVQAAPETSILLSLAERTYNTFLATDGEAVDGATVSAKPGAPALDFITAEMRSNVKQAISVLRSGMSSDRDGRHMYETIAAACLDELKRVSFEPFLQSEHYGYVLEMRAKEKRVPGLADFRLVRVLGQGGFGQVLEVIKRDCGKRYAMKVMHKEMMRRSLGSSWQRKIGLERDLLASLDHPFLVNLKYAFQNTEFLVLVMDLVRSSDLSEFVLGKRRLNRAQVKWVIMEVMVVMRYLHSKGVLYRDLKPENLLIDADGHIRLIDMGLAARISEKNPLRRSRVGTDIYMAPEVRFVKERKVGYGVLCDWYTIGVLAYELSSGSTPYVINDDHDPPYREYPFGDEKMEDFVRRLCMKDHRERLGSGPRGIAEIFEHPFWEGIDWDLVEKLTMPSPMLSLDRNKLARTKNEKENQAQQTASDLAEADREEYDKEFHLKAWDFVSPSALVEEYLENINHCVSTI